MKDCVWQINFFKCAYTYKAVSTAILISVAKVGLKITAQTEYSVI
jgi:hypothetical protein